jgi:hypothetical protein
MGNLACSSTECWTQVGTLRELAGRHTHGRGNGHVGTQARRECRCTQAGTLHSNGRVSGQVPRYVSALYEISPGGWIFNDALSMV